MKIKHNVGDFDRVLRFGIGLMMIYFGIFDNSLITSNTAGIVLSIFGIGILLTAVFRNCPLYFFAGIDTCTEKKQD